MYKVLVVEKKGQQITIFMQQTNVYVASFTAYKGLSVVYMWFGQTYMS